MTKEELVELIRATMAPELKGVADLVESNVRKAVEGRAEQPPAWVSQMFGGGKEAPKPREKGQPFAACVRALASTKGDPQRASAALKAWGYEDLAEDLTKAMTAGTPAAGGFLVPPSYSTDVIELLRPASVLRRLGAVTMPMPAGTMNIPKITSGATGYYVGESANVTPSQLVTGNLHMSFKKLAVLVPISNDLLRFSSPAADMVVRDDSVRCIAATENSYFIRSTGVSGPKGLRYWAHADNIVAAASTSLANASTDLGKLIGKLMAADIPFTRPGWLMSPRSYIYLTTVQTTTGQFAFRDEMQGGRLWGWPYAVTTSIPETLTVGSNADCSEVYLADFADVVLGESLGLVVDASSEAAYYDGSNVVASFSRDETVIRVIEEHDLGARRDKSIAVLTGVRWGV